VVSNWTTDTEDPRYRALERKFSYEQPLTDHESVVASREFDMVGGFAQNELERHLEAILVELELPGQHGETALGEIKGLIEREAKALARVAELEGASILDKNALRIARNEIEGLKALHGAAERECEGLKARVAVLEEAIQAAWHTMIEVQCEYPARSFDRLCSLVSEPSDQQCEKFKTCAYWDNLA
jgi:hypothetical protein